MKRLTGQSARASRTIGGSVRHYWKGQRPRTVRVDKIPGALGTPDGVYGYGVTSGMFSFALVFTFLQE